MNFNEEQQAHVDKLISKKYAEAMNKAEAKAAEQLAAAEAKHAGEVQTLKAENETLKAERGQQSERIRLALLKAEISQTGAVINAVQVMKLINENFKLVEDGELVVIDDKGTPQLDESGKPHTAGTFIEKFLADNLHLVKAAGNPGAGSFGARFDAGVAGAAKTMRRAQFDALDASRRKTFIQTG